MRPALGCARTPRPRRTEAKGPVAGQRCVSYGMPTPVAAGVHCSERRGETTIVANRGQRQEEGVQGAEALTEDETLSTPPAGR